MPIETFVLQGMLPADVFAPGSLTKGAWLTQDFFESSEKGWAQLPQGWNVFFGSMECRMNTVGTYDKDII